MGKRKAGPSGAFKLIETEITKLGDRLRKMEEQVNALRDLTWVAADLLNEFGGKKVKLQLLDGTTLKGVLERYDRFNIRVKMEKSRQVVVMKHAIASIEKA